MFTKKNSVKSLILIWQLAIPELDILGIGYSGLGYYGNGYSGLGCSGNAADPGHILFLRI
jgi:hypothetical protein